LDDVGGFGDGVRVGGGAGGVAYGFTLLRLSACCATMKSGLRTAAPITKGRQNQVRFLTSRKMWMKSKMNMTMAAIIPPAIEGVYGQSMYSGTAEESSAGLVVDMVDGEQMCAV
jgi:hypothetical protein